MLGRRGQRLPVSGAEVNKVAQNYLIIEVSFGETKTNQIRC